MSLKNKVILITGSSKGIGKETAIAFAKENAIVIITYNTNKEGATDSKKQCLASGATDAFAVSLDVTNSRSIKSAVREIIKKYKKIDFLINNSGVICWDEFKDQDFKIIESQVRTNLEGLIKMTSACIHYITEGIINISSGAGKTPYSDLTVYCATKYGVRGFTQSLAPAYPSLLIASVNPHMTSTQMTNFKGISPSKVASVILKTAKKEIKPDKCSDVDVWEYINT